MRDSEWMAAKAKAKAARENGHVDWFFPLVYAAIEAEYVRKDAALAAEADKDKGEERGQ